MGFLSSEPSAVERKIEELIGASPETLDTLNELAAALGDDENFATTVTNEIATKAPIESPTFTGTVGGVTKAMVGLDQVDNTSDLNKPISTATQTALDAEATTRADADTALDDRLDTVETTLPTKADLVGGVVPTAQMPAISIMERVSVADEAARLALTSPGQVQVGDVAVQADTGVTWLLIDVDPSLAASWKAIDQSDAVQSVNGQTGTVVLAKADIGLGNVDNTADLDKPISTATQTALDTKADDSTVVKLTGDQTVAGVKTFSSPPVVPTPTGATEAASKGYVDTAIANGTSGVTRVWVPAPDFFVNFGGPSQNGNRGIPNWLLDAAVAESLVGSCSVPADWTVQGYIWWANAGGGAGDVKWDIRSDAYTAGETPSTAAGVQPLTHASLVVTAGAQGVIVRTPVGSTGVVPDEILRTVVVRQANMAEDTLANDVHFFGVELVKVP